MSNALARTPMLFCSSKYFLFFCVVFITYWAIRHQRARVWLLLGASIYFYASWNRSLAGLIVLSTSVDFLLALLIERVTNASRRKALVAMSVCGNLALLIYFKYAGFFLTSLQMLLSQVGLSGWFPSLRVILPVGISFYTFEAINYTVDVYQRRVRAERRFDHLLLFITFFPHMVAGPIVRARDFLPQVGRAKRWSWMRAQLGAHYIIMGLFKKLAIADQMALYADPVFLNPHHYGASTIWVGVIAYTIQIYCDFSGYSDIALGCAHLLGYKLTRNFNLPYLAKNISEFWHRWHISLSTWIRDYVFIPLGGSRGGWVQTTCVLLVTMTLAGLWHGASWTFVAWGAFHGFLLVIHRASQRLWAVSPSIRKLLKSAQGQPICLILTLFSVMVGWILFRASSFEVAASVLRGMFSARSGLGLMLPCGMLWVTVVLLLLCHVLASRRRWSWLVTHLPPPVLGAGYATAVLVTLLLAPAAGKSFIYFQF